MTHDDRSRSLNWISRLVGIDTTSRNSNRELIDVVADECRRLGLEPHVFDSPDGIKANLVVTVPDRDGGRTGGVVISGHTDVVPVDGQNWTSDPWQVRVDDGKLYGRGVADMKGYIGIALEALPRFAEASLNRPLHLALTYDEEVGCLGGDAIVKQIAELGLMPDVALVGEPTSMEVVSFHKSMNVARVDFRGVPVHSSLTPQGVNAIEAAAEMVAYLSGIARGWREHGPFDDGYVVPYSTLSVNMISGGTAQNIVPAEASVVFEFRTLPQVEPTDVIASVRAEAERIGGELTARNPAAGATLTVLAQVPGLANTGAAAPELAAAIGAAGDGPKVTYGTEAGQFLASGVEAIVCGPGDIAQAHTPDEWITIEQVRACETYFDNLLNHLSQ
ncbi:MAG: acetylornithine deacetylase [Dermatophilus congolensis]|nr:acetylornithine deacetylase [Dermatophilus congolensis]